MHVRGFRAGKPVAVEEALARGAEVIQVFSSSPRTWRPTALDPAGARILIRAMRASDVRPLFVHAPYLVNLASPTPATRRHSRTAVEAGLEAAALLGAAGLVVHAGTAAGGSRTVALRRQARAILAALGEGLRGPRYLLELTSGAPGHLASRFEEAAQVLDACHGHPRIGLCIDTCHLHAAGYDLSTAAGVAETLERMRTALGRRRLGLVHANDSRDPRGSRRDRHWHVGEGAVGREGFRALVAHPLLRNVPFVCETPGDLEDDRRNIAVLKAFREEAGRDAGPGR